MFAAGQVGFGAFLHFGAEEHPHSDFLSIALHEKNFILSLIHISGRGLICEVDL